MVENRNNTLNNKGFSIVELLVALAISSIILVGITIFIKSGSDTYKVVSSQSILQNETQDLLNYFNRMLQGASDAGWRNGDFYVLQPDAINVTGNYIVHIVRYNQSENTVYYIKREVLKSNFNNSTLVSLNTGIENDDNIISNKVSQLDLIVERYAALVTPKPDGSEGDPIDSRTQSLSKVDIVLRVKSSSDYKHTKTTVRPRNTITSENFYNAGFTTVMSKLPYNKPDKVLARPNGDMTIGDDGLSTY